jgi:hypothetical protein
VTRQRNIDAVEDSRRRWPGGRDQWATGLTCWLVLIHVAEVVAWGAFYAWSGCLPDAESAAVEKWNEQNAEPPRSGSVSGIVCVRHTEAPQSLSCLRQLRLAPPTQVLESGRLRRRLNRAGCFLGPYEIQSAVGAGGMGGVYRTPDTQLKRDVALKILPSDLALDAGRLASFDREARALA